MPSCEDAEIMLEMSIHSALDAESRRELDQHLSGCLPCRRFAEDARASEARMRAAAELGRSSAGRSRGPA
jgi:hypothetical protein